MIHTRLIYPFQIIFLLIRGWIHILSKLTGHLWGFFLQKKWGERILFLLLLSQFISSGMGWFQYKIQFQGGEELAFISTKWNLYFVLGSAFNFFFTGFWKSKWVYPSFFVIQVIQLILLAVGSLDPSRFFVSLLRAEDYQFSPFYYGFVISAVLGMFVGLWNFWEDRKRFKSPITRTSPQG